MRALERLVGREIVAGRRGIERVAQPAASPERGQPERRNQNVGDASGSL
jgi:hypothetical protein